MTRKTRRYPWSRRVRYAGEACVLALLFAVFRAMPVDVASAVGGWIGRTIGPRLAASRKADTNVRLALPDVTPEERAVIVAGMWDNLARVIAEYPHLRYIVRNRVTVIGEPQIDAAMARKDEAGRGTVFFSMHVANWEVCPAYLKHVKGADIHLMYRAPNNGFVDAMIHHWRTLGGAIPAWNKSREGGLAALKAVRGGASLAILVDQKYNPGVNVPFFGLDAMTNPFFVKMARKLDVPLVPATLRRTGGVHFELSVYDPVVLEGRSDDDVMGEAHGVFEAAIRAAPEQWLWLHRRFKSV